MPQADFPMEVTPVEVKQKLDRGERVFLIDVREPAEHQQAQIAGAELIPMRTVPAALQSIEGMSDEAPIIVFCHHGVRSLQVVNWLREKGVPNCSSMSGGIDRWSCEVDASVPRYY
jgi:adenylyltransferase/sulfurtransferase